MKNVFRIVLFSLLVAPAYGQNLFPFKLDNCKTASFCLDCGDVKGGFEAVPFQEMLDEVASTYNLKSASGSIYFQVLVDDRGRGCVLSHTEQTNSAVVQTIVKKMNKFKEWTPASADGELKDKTSINVVVTFSGGQLSGVVERVSMPDFKESLRGARKPEIYNEDYVYKNENLDNYEISFWNRENSELSNDQNDNIAVDADGVLWYTMDGGLGKMEDGVFSTFGQDIHEVDENGLRYSALAIDNKNTTWVSTSKGIYSYDGTWHFHDPETTGINGVYKIINIESTGEVYFCSDEGLTIYQDGNWSNLDMDKIPELPSNRVYFAKKDFKGRIWIGTFSGSIMIDTDGTVIDFNKSKTPLKDRCVDAMTEDTDGNVYMGIYEFDGKGVVNRDEGLVILSNDGEWKQYTTDNSGMPFNHIMNLVYADNVLWIATDRAGLVRFNLTDEWENYHSANSFIPTSYVADVRVDKNGIIYLGTRLGIVKITKK